MKRRILPPYLQWRDGRPRWEPGPRLRPAWRGQDLKTDAGEWLGLEAAIARAKDLNNAVHAAHAGGNRARAPRLNRKPARTCNALWDLWASPADPTKASPRWQKLAAVTRRDYTSKIGVFLADFGNEPVAALTKGHLHTWWENLYRDRGHAMANGTLACARAMLSYAVVKEWRADNPAKSLDLMHVPPRVVVWTDAEIALFVEIADACGMHAIADAVVIALHTGQRQGDVRVLEWVSTANGRATLRQGKTRARVSVPFSPALQARLDAIKARRRAGQVAELQLTGKLVRDGRGHGYTREQIGRDFREVRDMVAAVLRSIAGKQFLDLRDTAVTRLALAGCTVAEIRAITGHSMETIHKVLAHYLAIDDRMADSAIARLKTWMQDEGIAI